MRTFDDLVNAMLAIFPESDVGMDDGGQIIIYTGKQLDKDNPLLIVDLEPDLEDYSLTDYEE